MLDYFEQNEKVTFDWATYCWEYDEKIKLKINK